MKNQKETNKPKIDSNILLPIRRSSLIEIGLFYLIAVVINFYFFGGDRYWMVSPHPFWIIILIISVQYGINEGLLAATMGTFILLTYNLPDQRISQDIYDYLKDISIRPIMWFSFVVILGQIQDRRLQKLKKLQKDLEESVNREKVISEEYKRINLLKNTLEIRIAGQMKTAVSIYQAVKDLGKLEPEEVLFSITDLVHALIKPEKFSIFLLKDNSLEILTTEGWETDEKYLQSIDQFSPIYQEVIGRQKILSVADPKDEHILSGEGILAGPLIELDSGNIFGILKIERLGFRDMNLSVVKNFTILCEWIGTAYHNAQRYMKVKNDSVLNHDSMLLSYSFFPRQTKLLTGMAKRIGFDITMLLIKITDLDKVSIEDKILFPRSLSLAVKNILRTIDLAFEYQTKGNEFAVVLPDTNRKNAQIVADKIQNELQNNLHNNLIGINIIFSIQELYKHN